MTSLANNSTEPMASAPVIPGMCIQQTISLGSQACSVNNHTRWNTVRAGVNYHFNWGAAPVVAKY